jgi:diguanylate cyclase (GGDEF)-like protein
MDKPTLSPDFLVPPLLELLLAVHGAPSSGWLADAAATAGERALGALYGLLYVSDANGQLACELPASTDRRRRLGRLQQALDADLTELRFSPDDVPQLRKALDDGNALVTHDLGKILPLKVEQRSLRTVQSQLGVAKAWMAPLHRSGETLGMLLLLMPATTPAPLAQAELLGKHIAVALTNLREREAGRKHGELDVVRWVYDERRFMDELALECRRASRHGRPLSVLYLQVRNLDELLHRYGRFLVERILRQVAGQLTEAMRDTDFLGAAGDDGLAAILVEADADGAERAKERLLVGLDSLQLHEAELPDLRVEFACATATMPDDGASADELAEVARARLATSPVTTSGGGA